MHELDVNNIKVTEFLGAGHLEMAESAFGRDDVKKKITKDECKEAVKMADWLQQKPGGYKSQLVACKNLRGCRLLLEFLEGSRRSPHDG